MSLKTFIIKQVSSIVANRIDHWKKSAVEDQKKILNNLVSKAKNTVFGRDHHFDQIKDYNDFKQQVPIRDYEELKPYFDRLVQGERDVFWPGLPKYFAKTSGTTSGVKYIPITADSMPNHINTARNALLNYFHQKSSATVFEGKVIFLSGSPELEYKSGIPTGRLSGIVNHEVPSWIRTNQLPSYHTNCIDDWETKLDKIVEETLHQDMRLISGIPPWVQMYYERLLEKTGKKTVLEVFPNYSLFMYGGVNFEPYRAKLEELVGKRLDSIETFPASEGFIAFQDDIDDRGLLLNTDSGIFFEFVAVDTLGTENPDRRMIDQVELSKDYALIINNNAGLWGYSIGDCVRFVSLNPYKILVSGRVKHFISAFGEHVIGKEVEEAILSACNTHHASIVEFTVAPQVSPPEGGLPYHEWFVEFDRQPTDLVAFAKDVNEALSKQNIYYEDLMKGHVLRPLVISVMQQDAFREYMKTQGKLGGQNKVPRLSNDRKIADVLQKFIA